MLTEAQTRAWLTVRLAPGMTRARLAALARRYPTPEEMLGASASKLSALRGFDPQSARAVLDSPRTAPLDTELDRMSALSVTLLTPSCPDYPENLWRSSTPPPLLYVRGAFHPNDRYAVAIVGSREPTAYGLAVSKRFAARFAKSGVTVVSGFARGIDSSSHSAALDAGGRTIAVLGCGMAVPYPSGSAPLSQRIADDHGVIVSEYPMDTPPAAQNFPERNYIIAALALGTIVVEAAERSGALITAHQALEENRFVFAVPGDVTRFSSRGANRLIRHGEARLVQSADEVLEEMADLLTGYLKIESTASADALEPSVAATDETYSPEEAEDETPAHSADRADAKDEHPQKAHKNPPQPDPPEALDPYRPTPSAATPATLALTHDEQQIYDALRDCPQHLDALAAQFSPNPFPVSRISALLLTLELKRAIQQLPGRIYKLPD